MDQDWDLSLYMRERYLWALSVIQHHKKLASNVTKELVTGSCFKERVKRLAGDEIELGMEIPTIESRSSNISRLRDMHTGLAESLTSRFDR